MNLSKSVYVKRNFQEETGQLLKDYRPNQKIQKSLGSRISESIKTFLSKFIQNKQRNSIKVSINSEELVAVPFDQTDIFREFSVQSKVVQEQDYSLKPQIQEPPQKKMEGKKGLYSFAKFAEQQKNKKYQSNLTKKNQNFLFKKWLKKSNRNKKPQTMQDNKYKDKHVNKKSKLNGIKVQLQIMLNRKLKKSQLQNSLTENSVIDFGFININHHSEERDLSESSISEDFRESMIQKVSKENEQSSFMEDCLLIDYSKQKKQLNSSFSYYNKESLTQVYPQQDQVINNQYETNTDGFITLQPNKEAAFEKKSNIQFPVIKDQQLEVTVGNKDVDKTEKEVVVPSKSILEKKDKEVIQKKEQDLILNNLKSPQTPLFSFFNHNVIQNNEKVKQNIQQETNDQLIKVIPSFLVGKQNNVISPPQKPQSQSIFGEIRVLDQFDLDKQKFGDILSQPSIESIQPQQQQKSLFSDLLNIKPENSINQFTQSSGQGIFSNLIFNKPQSIGMVIKPLDKNQEIEPQSTIIAQAAIDGQQIQPQQSGLFNKPIISPTVQLKPLNEEASKPDTSDDKQIFPSKGLFSGFLFNKPEPIDTLDKQQDKKQEFELRPRRTAEVQIDVDEPQNQHPETITQLQTSSFGNVPLLNQIQKPEQQSLNQPIQSQELMTNTREKTYLTPQKDSVTNINNPFLQNSPDIDKEVMNKLFAGNLFQPLMQGLKQDSTQQAPQNSLFQLSQFAAPQNPNPFIQTKENLNISFTPQQQPNFSLFGNNYQQQVQQQQTFQQPQQNTLFTQNQSTQNSIFGNTLNTFTSQQQMIPSQHTGMYVNQTAQPSNSIYNPNTSYSQYSQDQSMDMDEGNNRYPTQVVQVAPFNTNQGLFGAGQQQQGFYSQQNAELFQPAQQQQQNQSQSLFGPELENKRVMNQNDIYGNQGNNKRKQKQRIG